MTLLEIFRGIGAMAKITEIPRTDYQFLLGDLIAGKNYLGLRYTGGVYFMVEVNPQPPHEIVYAGISSTVGARLKSHVNVYKETKGYSVNYNPNMVYKLITKFNFTLEDAQEYLKGLTVLVILEEDAVKRREIEKFIINNYSPRYNLVR